MLSYLLKSKHLTDRRMAIVVNQMYSTLKTRAYVYVTQQILSETIFGRKGGYLQILKPNSDNTATGFKNTTDSGE